MAESTTAMLNPMSSSLALASAAKVARRAEERVRLGGEAVSEDDDILRWV